MEARSYVWSGGNPPQQAAHDRPVKRHDDRQIGAAEPIVRPYQRRRRDLLDRTGRYGINDNTKIQMAVVEAGDQPFRCFAHDRKHADHAAGGAFSGAGGLQEL